MEVSAATDTQHAARVDMRLKRRLREGTIIVVEEVCNRPFPVTGKIHLLLHPCRRGPPLTQQAHRTSS